MKMDTKAFAQEFIDDRSHLYRVFAEQGLVKPMPGVVRLVKAAFHNFGELVTIQALSTSKYGFFS
jgi:hypothetical protein